MSGCKGDMTLHKTVITFSTRIEKLKAPQHSRLELLLFFQ